MMQNFIELARLQPITSREIRKNLVYSTRMVHITRL